MVSRARKVADFGANKIVEVLGTTRTLQLSDSNEILKFENNSDVTVTIPRNSDTSFPTGTVITLLRDGDGKVTVVAGTGVTLRGTETVITKQYNQLICKKIGSDTWVVSGLGGGGVANVYESVASTGSVTLDLENSNYFDAGTLTGSSTITFGTPVNENTKFTYTFIPGYINSPSQLDDINNWTVDNTNLQPVFENSFLLFNGDGTKVIYGSSGFDEAVQYDLSIPYHLESADGRSEVRFDLVNYETSPRDMVFNDDGTKLFFVGTSGDSVDEFDLSTAYDISTASYSTTFSVGAQETQPQVIQFKPDGTKMYIGGATGDGIDQFALSTAFDVSTASWEKFESFNTLGTTGISSINFNSDGTMLYVTSTSTNNALLKSYELPTAWTIENSGTSEERLITKPDAASTNGIVPISLDRFYATGYGANGFFIERGVAYKPVFSTSFSGKIPDHYSRGYRHFLEFETHDTGSNYQLVSHRKIIV